METESCTHGTAPVAAVPVDAVWGDWGYWSECSRSCGSGYKARQRQIVTHASDGGKPVEGPIEEYSLCDQEPCHNHGIDCEYSDWSSWGSCSQKCTGTKTRSRSITVYAMNGGAGCNSALAEVAPCNDDPICHAVGEKVDCVLSEWAPSPNPPRATSRLAMLIVIRTWIASGALGTNGRFAPSVAPAVSERGTGPS